MGTLFPNCPEFPDHTSLPSGFGELITEKALDAAVVGAFNLALAVPVAALCPVMERHAHPPHPISSLTQHVAVVAPIASGSSSSDPLTWSNRSVFDAADTVIRNARAARDAQTRAAMSSTSYRNAALLDGDVL